MYSAEEKNSNLTPSGAQNLVNAEATSASENSDVSQGDMSSEIIFNNSAADDVDSSIGSGIYQEDMSLEIIFNNSAADDADASINLEMLRLKVFNNGAQMQQDLKALMVEDTAEREKDFKRMQLEGLIAVIKASDNLSTQVCKGLNAQFKEIEDFIRKYPIKEKDLLINAISNDQDGGIDVYLPASKKEDVKVPYSVQFWAVAQSFAKIPILGAPVFWVFGVMALVCKIAETINAAVSHVDSSEKKETKYPQTVSTFLDSKNTATRSPLFNGAIPSLTN